MDENDLNKLSAAQQDRFRDYEDMFQSPGWQRLVFELKEHTGQLVNTALTVIGDERGLYFAKGQLQAAMAIINLESGITQEMQSVLDTLAANEEEALASKGSNA